MSPALKAPPKKAPKPIVQAAKKTGHKKATAKPPQAGVNAKAKLQVNPTHEETNWIKEAIKDKLSDRLSATEVNRLNISQVTVTFVAEGPRAILSKVAEKPKV